LAGAAILVAAVVFGILGCEQNATHEAAMKPAAGPHTQASPTPRARPTPGRTKDAGPHTQGTATPTQ
jgi:hypothetical protein